MSAFGYKRGRTHAPYWKENIKRSLRDWSPWQTGIGLAGSVLALLGYAWLAEEPTIQWAFSRAIVGYLAMLIFVSTPWSMWNDAQAERARYEERLKPKLSIVFDPTVRPYCQVVPRTEAGEPLQLVRIFRVGVRNESDTVIRDVRVVIESLDIVLDGQTISPEETHPGLLEHALNVMGVDAKSGRTDVAPGGRPTAYFDVVSHPSERTAEGEDEVSAYVWPCYASGHVEALAVDLEWRFMLRVEGGGTFANHSFLIRKGHDGQVVMEPADA
jgi:hypothetical protein